MITIIKWISIILLAVLTIWGTTIYIMDEYTEGAFIKKYWMWFLLEFGLMGLLFFIIHKDNKKNAR